MFANPHDRDLWDRFDRIALGCDVNVARKGDVWQVTIRERGNGHHAFVSAPRSLLEAVAEVVNSADGCRLGPSTPAGVGQRAFELVLDQSESHPLFQPNSSARAAALATASSRSSAT